MRRLTHVIGVSVIDQTRIGALSQNRLDTAAAGGRFEIELRLFRHDPQRDL
jgi:hypothetical protein